MPFSTLAIDASRADTAQKTGTDWYSREIILALARIRERPELVLYRRTGSTKGIGKRIRTRRVSLPRLWTHGGLSVAMRQDRPDALFVPAHVIPIYHPSASVVTIHDLGYLYEPAAHTAKRRVELDLSTRWNVRSARRIIAVSNQTKGDLVESYGADARKVRVVHHGVNHRRFRQLDEDEIQAVLSRYSLSDPYILFLSTVQPRKNVVRLVEAFEQLRDMDIALVIVGKTGWLSRSIEERIASSVASKRIYRLGHVPDRDLPAIYNGAELFVLPSLYEGFGMGILEAMACGCPVVTSNRSSMPEVAGNAAAYVNPQSVDSIRAGIEVALSSDARKQLIQRGLVRAGQFSWATAAAKTLLTVQEAYDDAHS